MTIPAEEFFPLLKRRPKYTTKNDQEFYSYAHYRQNFHHEIAEDCQERCVYCDSHEHEVGGRESMEIDHFRPWSEPRFAHLECDPINFHHSCGRCNRFKGERWPSTHEASSHDGLVGFVDPFGDDRRKYFAVKEDGALVCLQHPAAYMMKSLHLDRPLLRLLRMRRILRRELKAYIEKMIPELQATVAGAGTLSKEEIAAASLKIIEYQRLLDLCDAPLSQL
jgi:hypothetical protein